MLYTNLPLILYSYTMLLHCIRYFGILFSVFLFFLFTSGSFCLKKQRKKKWIPTFAFLLNPPGKFQVQVQLTNFKAQETHCSLILTSLPLWTTLPIAA